MGRSRMLKERCNLEQDGTMICRPVWIDKNRKIPVEAKEGIKIHIANGYASVISTGDLPPDIADEILRRIEKKVR